MEDMFGTAERRGSSSCAHLFVRYGQPEAEPARALYSANAASQIGTQEATI
jgi:hypothetical protein